MVAVAVLSLLVVMLVGGDLRRLAQVQFRATWLIFLALALQILVISVVNKVTWLPNDVIHSGTYVLAAIFVVLNRHIPGALIIGLGAVSNGFTISINGGTLPASPIAYAKAGIPVSTGEFENSAPLAHPKLSFLGDIFYIPQGWPLANVFSVGDIAIWIGVAVAVYGICVPPEKRFGPFRRPPQDAPAPGTDLESGRP